MIGSFSAFLYNAVNNSLSLCLAASANNNLCALGGKNLSNTYTDTACRTGYNSNLTFKSVLLYDLLINIYTAITKYLFSIINRFRRKFKCFN